VFRNPLPTVDTLSPSDVIGLYSNPLGHDAQFQLSTLVAFIAGQLNLSESLHTQYASPNASGFNIQIAPLEPGSDVFLLLTPLAAYAVGAITLPLLSSCVDGQEVLVTCTDPVTAFTVNGNGALVNGAPSALAANSTFRLRFDLITGAWYVVAGNTINVIQYVAPDAVYEKPPVFVTASRNFANSDSGATLVLTGAWTLTMVPGLNSGWSCAIAPPASGVVTVAASGGATLNGAATSITRAVAANILFSVVNNGTNTYLVTGS
jgi:hypothetical protein